MSRTITTRRPTAAELRQLRQLLHTATHCRQLRRAEVVVLFAEGWDAAAIARFLALHPTPFTPTYTPSTAKDWIGCPRQPRRGAAADYRRAEGRPLPTRRPVAGSSDQPPNGWVGQGPRNQSDRSDWPYIGIVPDRLKEIMQKRGYEYDAVVSTWKDRGWLSVDPKDKSGKHRQVVIGENRPRVVVIKREAFRDAGCIHDEETDTLRKLREVGRVFLLVLQNSSLQHCAREARADAIRSVQTLLTSLRDSRGQEPEQTPDAVGAASLGQ